jgi:hypothetical protein
LTPANFALTTIPRSLLAAWLIGFLLTIFPSLSAVEDVATPLRAGSAGPLKAGSAGPLKAGSAGPLKAGSAGPLKAGSAVVDITPKDGLPLWGYGGRKDLPATGARDSLEASVVVLDFGPLTAVVSPAGQRTQVNGRLALIGLDLGRGPARQTMASLRKKLKEKAGVDHVFVVGSHTHHGPCLELEKSEPTASWIREMVEKVTTATAKAVSGLRPAKFAVASVDVELNRNRHSKISPQPVDRSLIVMRIDGVDDRPIATVVNFAAHPTSLPWNQFKYSADYPGPLKDHVEKTVGGVCVFLQGAAGDQSTDRRGKSMSEYGVAVGEAVIGVWRKIVPKSTVGLELRLRREELSFPNMRVDLKEPLTRMKYTLAFFKSLVDAYIEEYENGVRPQLQVATIGEDIGIVGVSGEVFCQHAIRLRKRARLRTLLFVGYCNGYHQYFPTIEAVAEGGYGADPEVSPVSVGAGERIMNRALFHLYDLRKKLK